MARPDAVRGGSARGGGLPLAVLLVLVAAITVPGVARADDAEERGPEVGLVLDLDLVAGLDPETSTLGLGNGASFAVLFRPHPVVSLAAGGHLFALYGEGPVAWFGTRAGVRLHWGALFGMDPDAWIEVNHIWGLSGSVTRHGLDVGIGIGFPFFDALYAGPAIHLQFIEDPDGTPVWLLSLGLSIGGWPMREGRAPEPWRSRARPPHYVPPRNVRAAEGRRSRVGHAWVLPDVELFGLHGVDDAHRDELGFGGGASASLEIPLVPWLGVHAGATGMALSAQSGRPAAWAGSHLGLRFHWTPLAGVEGDGWIDVHHVFGVSGGISTHGGDAGLGYSFDVASFLRVGPFARVTMLTDPAGDPAFMLAIGVSVMMRQPTPGPGNRDGDFVLDRDDHCIETEEGMVDDPDNPGCPLLDRDGDGIPDDRDLCSNDPAHPYPDPDRLGCPLRDGDGDGVPDAHDFCVDVAADPDDSDPLRDGCPRGLR